MNLIVNPGIELRGVKGENKFIYYNGRINELKVKNFDLFWDIFESLTKDSCLSLEEVAIKYHVPYKELDRLLLALHKAGILVSEQKINKKNMRLVNHFSCYCDHIVDKNELPFANQTVCVIGCGTTGAEIAMSLAKMGIQRLILIDGDLVEQKNITAQHIFEWQDVGRPKCDVLREKILSSSSVKNIEVHNIYMDSSSQVNLSRVTCFVDCADNLDTKIRINLIKYAVSQNARYFFCGYSFDQGHIFQFSNSFIAEKYLLQEEEGFDSQYSMVENRGTITFSTLVTGTFLAKFEQELLDNSFPRALRITISTHSLEINEQDLTKNVLPNLYNKQDYENFIDQVSHIKNGSAKNINMIKNVYLYLQLLEKLGCFPQGITNLHETYKLLTEELNERHNKVNEYENIIKKVTKSLKTEKMFDYLDGTNSNYTPVNVQKERRVNVNNKVSPYISQLLEIVKENYNGFQVPNRIKSGFNDETFNSHIINDFFPKEMNYYGYSSKSLSLMYGMNILSKSLDKETFDFISKLFATNQILVTSENMNLENDTIFFDDSGISIICMTYGDTIQDFLVLLHEIGHVKYNLESKENRSNIDSELFANKFLLDCVHKIMISSNLSKKTRIDFNSEVKIFFGKELSLCTIILCLGIHLSENELVPNIDDYIAFRQRIDRTTQQLGTKLIASNDFYSNLILTPHLYVNPQKVLIEVLGILLIGNDKKELNRKNFNTAYSQMVKYINDEVTIND